jgi:hypothetical protein
MIYGEDPLRRRPGKSTARRTRQKGSVWMTENMDKWPSKHGKTEKSGHRLAAAKTLFSRRWYGGMISANLEVIWEMSANTICLVFFGPGTERRLFGCRRNEP